MSDNKVLLRAAPGWLIQLPSGSKYPLVGWRLTTDMAGEFVLQPLSIVGIDDPLRTLIIDARGNVYPVSGPAPSAPQGPPNRVVREGEQP